MRGTRTKRDRRETTDDAHRDETFSAHGRGAHGPHSERSKGKMDEVGGITDEERAEGDDGQGARGYNVL